MNVITMDGTITEDAQMDLVVAADGTETPIVKFSLMDTGAPFSKKKPTFIEVDFTKEAATNIFPYLLKGKTVIVYGSLSTKGTKNSKYYIAANVVKFVETRGVK